ncbi:hypothetical protein MSG28_003804 [Choristoneura fumiferana]|uniref:Uncharacterized protein n=1 Tax=Choristoneura fumiferana TaxID=7141 RepID=A0ACC0KGD7_CHOFU|nr:hypothetical protein MSG28_003804 [Choristoneura fumiferana]
MACLVDGILGAFGAAACGVRASRLATEAYVPESCPSAPLARSRLESFSNSSLMTCLTTVAVSVEWSAAGFVCVAAAAVLGACGDRCVAPRITEQLIVYGVAHVVYGISAVVAWFFSRGAAILYREVPKLHLDLGFTRVNCVAPRDTKARIFTHYEDRTMYDTLGGIFMTLCNPVGCSDELALSLCVTVILKECFVKMLWNFYYFITLRTDYNQGILLNMDVPCWEREYRLPTVKDDFIHDKMKSLVVQFVLTIVFICGCPFTPIFAIFVNIFDIRRPSNPGSTKW